MCTISVLNIFKSDIYINIFFLYKHLYNVIFNKKSLLISALYHYICQPPYSTDNGNSY